MKDFPYIIAAIFRSINVFLLVIDITNVIRPIVTVNAQTIYIWRKTWTMQKLVPKKGRFVDTADDVDLAHV